MKTTLALLTVTALFLTFLPAQAVSGDEILSSIRILSDDSMEGRGTGSRGERKAADYVVDQFRKAGLQPAGGRSYIQQVPLIGVTADPSMQLVFEGPSGRFTAAYYEDFMGCSGVARKRVDIDSEVIFAGYGISAPEMGWDDFKGVDVRGKVILALVNDPPSDDPAFFGGRAMTYYGRWSYKYEEAVRRGAAGALLVHMTEKAGYGWPVVQKSWMGELFQLRERPIRLPFRGWIRGDVAEKLLASLGQSLPDLVAAAGKPDFRPVPLPVRMKTRIQNRVRKLEAPNVAGILPGTGQPEQAVCLIAHIDHFGIGKPDATGDRIYNGASDNATGVAALIALARAFRESKPRDSIVFLAVTGEEQGLLGSQYYTLHPLFPLEKTTAAISLDGLNVYGRTRDFEALGAEQSRLGPLVEEVAGSMGMVMRPDSQPERGYFFRSDHFSFARAGVPGISVNGGVDYVGRPAGWGEAKNNEFIAKMYHQPGDEIQPDWDMAGLVQVLDFVQRLVARIGEEPGLVPWNPGSPYQRK